MGSRNTVPWAATSVPEIRRQWCNALDDVAALTSEGLKPQTGSLAGTRKLARMQASLAESIEAMTTETEVLRSAQLFWVSRNMTEAVVSAAATLPEWTPAVAAPAPAGLLCWARPAGVCNFAQAGGVSTEVAWDALWWFTRADGVMQLTPASRLTKAPELLAPYNVTSPLWSAQTVVLDPRAPRTEEFSGSPEAHQFVSILGAAWLLMGQPSFTDTRTVSAQTAERRTAGQERPTQMVTLIDINRPPASKHNGGQGNAGDGTYDHRWWVRGYWRSQPYGPKNSQRRPQWIDPHIKGPDGTPLKTRDKVHVLRH